MSYRMSDIIFERAPYFVVRAGRGFEVYQNQGTHSRRCAIIGFPGSEGINRATAEIDRRISEAAE